jgi:hypothetical protein
LRNAFSNDLIIWVCTLALLLVFLVGVPEVEVGKHIEMSGLINYLESLLE